MNIDEEQVNGRIPKMFIGSKDLQMIVEILVKADNITPEEAVMRINKMCDKGTLSIVPFFGKQR